MPLLSGNEFKVALVIYRETVGWNRDSVALSFADLEKRTGISIRSLKNIVKSLLKKGIIQLCDRVGRWGMNVYTLAKRYLTGEDTAPTSAKTALVQRPLLSSSAEITQLVVQELHQYPAQNCTTTSAEIAPDETPSASFDAAPEALPRESERGAKETLKEKKENIKERSAEKAQEEEEEPEEEDYEPSAPEWGTVLEKLKPQISSAAFSSWFRSSRAFKREDQFIIQVESSFHKRHMQRFAGLIRSILVPMLPPSMDVFIATADELRAPALAVAVGV